MGKSFAAVNEKRKTQITDSRLFPAPILRLHELLASDAFVERMSVMSGIANLVADPKLAGGGIHETDQGGHLDVHVDFNYNEDLGLYPGSTSWSTSTRIGARSTAAYLDLWNEDVTRCVGRFAPTFNRAAGFATSATSWHGVTPVKCPPGRVRKSFAAYYYTREPPPAGTASSGRRCFMPGPTNTGRAARDAGGRHTSGRPGPGWTRSGKSCAASCASFTDAAASSVGASPLVPVARRLAGTVRALHVLNPA